MPVDVSGQHIPGLNTQLPPRAQVTVLTGVPLLLSQELNLQELFLPGRHLSFPFQLYYSFLSKRNPEFRASLPREI